MKRATEMLRVSSRVPKRSALQRAAQILRCGGLVAFPTETVYGLAADAFNEKAIRSLFKAKGRPADNPLIVHVASLAQARALAVDFPPLADLLAKKFWAGPLTLIVRHSGKLPRAVTAGLDTVAVRIPAHPVALGLIRALGHPIVAPSANLSGRPSPTRAAHVAHDLSGRIDLILDSGATRIGLESTVLDVTVSPPVILRKGGVTREQLEKAMGSKVAEPHGKKHLKRSPGTRHKHYSPRARVVLVGQDDVKMFFRVFRKEMRNKKAIGVIVHSSVMKKLAMTGAKKKIFSSNDREYAHGLFHALRSLDSERIDVIVVETIARKGLGVAVMDRLERAAAGTSAK